MLQFPLVLSIVCYHMRTHKQKRENLSAMPFSQISIDYFVTSHCAEFLRCRSSVVGLISWITAVIRCENYANQTLETKNSVLMLGLLPAFSN